jgi:hypothetical protein
MVHISILRKIEQQFRSSIFKEEGFIFLFTDLNVIDIKQRSYTYHHQKYMLQFQESSKVQRLNSQGEKIPHFFFGFCPFNMMPSKDVPLKPLIGTILVIFLASPVNHQNVLTYFFSIDLIGVITHVGPHDLASPTSHVKLCKLKIIVLE